MRIPRGVASPGCCGIVSQRAVGDLNLPVKRSGARRPLDLSRTRFVAEKSAATLCVAHEHSCRTQKTGRTRKVERRKRSADAFSSCCRSFVGIDFSSRLRLQERQCTGNVDVPVHEPKRGASIFCNCALCLAPALCSDMLPEALPVGRLPTGGLYCARVGCPRSYSQGGFQCENYC
jgi:hypothetical protein